MRHEQKIKWKKGQKFVVKSISGVRHDFLLGSIVTLCQNVYSDSYSSVFSGNDHLFKHTQKIEQVLSLRDVVLVNGSAVSKSLPVISLVNGELS